MKIVMLSLMVVLAATQSAVASVSRGDVEGLANSWCSSFALVYVADPHSVVAAPNVGDIEGRIDFRTEDVVTYKAGDWHIIGQGFFTFGLQYSDARAMLDQRDTRFILDGVDLASTRRVVARTPVFGGSPEPVFCFNIYSILAPEDLAIGSHTLEAVLLNRGVESRVFSVVFEIE